MFSGISKWVQKILVLILITQFLIPIAFVKQVQANDEVAATAGTAATLAQNSTPAAVVESLSDEVREALQKLEECSRVPVCPASGLTPYRTAQPNPCELTPRHKQVLTEYMQGDVARIQSMREFFQFGSIMAFISAGFMGLTGFFATPMLARSRYLDIGNHLFFIVIGAIAGSATLLSVYLTQRSFRAGLAQRQSIRGINQSTNQALSNEGHDPARVRRLLAESNRRPHQGWFSRLGARLRARLSRGAAAGSRAARAGSPATNAAPTANASEPRSGVRIDVRDDGHGHMCVTDASVQAAANAVAEAMEAAAAAEAQAQAEVSGRGRQAVAGGGNQNRAVSHQETTSHMCAPQRVQQYAQSLAVDRATRWHEFERRQRRDMALMELADVDRFNRAQRAELIQGGAAIASGVVGGVIVCATGGTATPLVAMGQQLLGRASVSFATAVALTAGTVSLLPADASAEELGQAQSCGFNAPRVSLPQANATQAYMAIPATIMSERRSPTASYDPARSPMCWVPAADACAALRQEFANHNIARLIPGVCSGTATAPSAAPTAPMPSGLAAPVD